MASSTAGCRILLIRMRSEVQVLAGPPPAITSRNAGCDHVALGGVLREPEAVGWRGGVIGAGHPIGGPVGPGGEGVAWPGGLMRRAMPPTARRGRDRFRPPPRQRA